MRGVGRELRAGVRGDVIRLALIGVAVALVLVVVRNAAEWVKPIYWSSDVRDGCAGFCRGILVVALQALGVIAITARSVPGSAAVSGAIALLWLANVESAARGSAYRIGFVCGSALGSAVVVWGAR